MPPKRAIDGNARAGVRANGAVEVTDEGGGRGKRQKVRTQRAIEGDSLPAGTASQPIELPETQLTAPPSPQSSPSRGASQPAMPAEDPLVGQVIDASQRPWELQLLESQALLTPSSASKAAIEASTVEDDNVVGGGFDERFADNYDGIDWEKLARYQVPRRTLIGKKSWVFQYGFCVPLLPPQRADEQHNRGDGCHKLCGEAPRSSKARPSPNCAREAAATAVTQAMVNKLSNFDIQGFWLAAVQWLVENNHPLREFETESFQRILQFANPAAVQALWTSHNSVSRFVLQLYDYLVPIVKAELVTASSKVHVSFDGWTAKGGKRGFFGVVAHYVDTAGRIRDLINEEAATLLRWLSRSC